MKNLLSGCGCLIVLIFAIVAGAISYSGPPLLKTAKESGLLEKSEETEKEELAAHKKRLAEIEAEGKRKQAVAESNLSRFMEFLNKAELNGIVSAIESDGDEKWVKIELRDAWHINAYQIRLQSAQNLYKIWSNIASPREPDLARIKIVDQNGNEVGGSRALAGSLIWVSEK